MQIYEIKSLGKQSLSEQLKNSNDAIKNCFLCDSALDKNPEQNQIEIVDLGTAVICEKCQEQFNKRNSA